MGTTTLRLSPPKFAHPKTGLAIGSPDSQRNSVRWFRLVIGVLITVTSILGVWLFVQSQSEPVQIWVAKERIDAGQEIQRSDLHIVSVEADSLLAAITVQTQVVGRKARTTIPQHSAFVEGHFYSEQDKVGIAEGKLAHVAVVFEIGALPSNVERNDLLRVQVAARRDSELLRAFEPVPVHSVEHLDRHTIITAELEHGQAAELLAALANGQTSAAIIGRR